jgi:hypothetical protein
LAGYEQGEEGRKDEFIVICLPMEQDAYHLTEMPVALKTSLGRVYT